MRIQIQIFLTIDFTYNTTRKLINTNGYTDGQISIDKLQ
jgi:hypothetical protein